MNGRRNAGQVLGHVAVVIVILAVIAAAFAISYDPVRDIARNAGVQSWLIRFYPGVLDAVFLVACACALLVRGARWWNRLYAWFSVLATGALIGAADVYHATGLRLPRRTMDGTVWALPWALVLLGFSLWLTTLQRGKSADRDPAETPAADAPVLVLESTAASRAALPAPGGIGGLAEVGFGAQAAGTAADAQPNGVPAHIEKGAEDVEPRAAAEAAQPGAIEAENAPGPQEPAEPRKPAVPAEAEDTARAEDPMRAEDTAPAEEVAQPEPTAPTAERAGVADNPETAGTGEAEGTDELADTREAAEADTAEKVAESGEVAEAELASEHHEPEWPFEAAQPAPARTATEANHAVAATDDDTPPYGFPAVSDQDEAPRMPTLLSAPVPADMETAPVPAEAEDPTPAEPPAPTPFERVRSTPTRPRPEG